MTSIRKRTVKRSVQERWRLLRYAIHERARYYPQLVFSLGSSLECPAVGSRPCQRGALWRGGVDPVSWRVNCFRNFSPHPLRGGYQDSAPGSIVDPEGTVRSPVPCDRPNIMGDR
jgi:hypothetical protein